MEKWETLNSKIVLDNKFFRVKQDLVRLPNQETKEWTYWDSKDSVMIIGQLPNNKLIMIRQYRYLVDDEVIEFPSGGLLENEDPKKGAEREFAEETGYRCANLKKLGEFYETYGQLDRKIHIFFTNTISASQQNLDKGEDGFEDIRVELVDFDKAVEFALNNKILAMGSTLAILLLKEQIELSDK